MLKSEGNSLRLPPSHQSSSMIQYPRDPSEEIQEKMVFLKQRAPIKRLMRDEIVSTEDADDEVVR